MQKFADTRRPRIAWELSELWSSVFPMIVPPSQDDGLGLILLNSNADAHFALYQRARHGAGGAAGGLCNCGQAISARLLDRRHPSSRRGIPSLGDRSIGAYRDHPLNGPMVSPTTASILRSRAHYARSSTHRLARRVPGTSEYSRRHRRSWGHPTIRLPIFTFTRSPWRSVRGSVLRIRREFP